ncbi:hypothetical protein AB0F71_03710 [Kitasatospora sp. NPDC028055]|uniref:hypothetical protein n=1 Tax=Kitasatospora sp. NPDC028055 TaxID=3155653 RepID=UPI0033DE5FE8
MPACPGGERVGIRGSRIVPGCPKLKLVDLIRLRKAAKPQPSRVPRQGTLTVEMHGARIYGTAPQIAELMREYGR